VRKDHRKAGYCRGKLQERLEQLNKKVDAVGQFTHDTDPEENGEEAKGIHAPTAE
jgi:hypothetical protein